MLLKEPFVGESKEIKRKDWSLIYNPEFEQYREKYKNIISLVKRVIDGEKVEGIEGEMLKQTSNGKMYFTIEIGGEKFFVKKIPENHKQGGVGEFKFAEEAKRRLENNNVEKVKVIDYIFGYTGNGFRFVVSRYDERLKTILSSYMEYCLENKRYKELHDLDDRFSDLKKIFNDYGDFKVENMAYDKEKDEIILFDLNDDENSLTESSDDEL